MKTETASETAVLEAARAYGPHLTIDGYEAPRSLLGNYQSIFDLLDRLPEQIGMTKITQPYVFPYYCGQAQSGHPEWGITGVVIIAESHISIHTYPEKGIFFMDVFSCKSFDTEETLEFVRKALRPKRIDRSVVQRGLDFPR